MLTDESLQVPGIPSFQLSSTSTGKEKYPESNTTNSSSTQTVVRRTTSWRWVIIFSSFCVHFVADGVLFSFGILMHIIKDDLHIELHTVGIIASLFVSLPLFCAPLSSALVNKFGCRIMTMLGGVLCSMGLLIASLSGNFTGALIGIGITCGIGLSCVYVPSVVIVAHYFDEHRAIATAIAVGGTGLGNALVAQLIHRLNDYYSDWRDTTFLLSAILFTIVGFGALFRPAEFSFCHKNPTINDTRLPPSCMTSMEKLQRFIKDMDKQCASRQANQSVSREINDLDLFDSYSADDIKEFQDEAIDRKQISITDKPDKEIDILKHPSTRFLSVPKEKQLLEVYHQPISQKDIFYPGNVPLKSSSLSRTSCPNLIQRYVYEESITSTSDDQNDPIQNHHYRHRLSFLHTLRRMLGLQLFRDYRYVIFFISQFLFYLFYDLIYLFPVDYGETIIGYTKKQMTMLITILGLGQFFGQILFGFLANYSCINELILYNIGAILCGLASLLIPFVVYSYIALLIVILIFGLAISANYALTSIILANMCGLELLTSAYGLILLGQGLSSLFGPIIGGWIAEQYGYKTSLIIAGIFMGISGFVPLLIPLIQRIRDKEENNKEKTIKTNTITVGSDSSS